MRLTKKNIRMGYPLKITITDTEGNVISKNNLPQDTENSLRCQIYNKLADLEDIEEELGIELSIVIKGAINGIWYNSNGTLYFERMDVSFSEKCFREYIDYCKNYNEFYFKDYGKTWALTKEELE